MIYEKNINILGFINCASGNKAQMNLNNYLAGKLIRSVLFPDPKVFLDKSEMIFFIQINKFVMINNSIIVKNYRILKLIDGDGNLIS